jgi:hypothetical protein
MRSIDRRNENSTTGARPYSDSSKQTSSDPVYRPTFVLDRRVRAHRFLGCQRLSRPPRKEGIS